MELRLGAWQPKYFNQNGELANIKVLITWLAFCGIRAEFVPLLTPRDSAEVDFVLVGDAGRAAIRNFNPELLIVAERVLESESKPTALFLGKAFESVSAQAFGLDLAAASRVSEFSEFDSEYGKVRGYLNSRLEPVGLVRFERLWGSSLHGPILASSPGLRLEILKRLGLGEGEPGAPEGLAALERTLGWI